MKPMLFLRPLCGCVLLILLSVFTVPSALADTSVGGTIATDTTWTLAGSPYIVTSNITVKGTDGADGITTLTIEPGVEIRMTRYRQMIIGATSGDPGALSAQGTAADPIVFTSNEASPAVGDWYYIKFDNTSADSTTVMDHCVVEYAGGSQTALYLYNASPTITNTAVRFNKNAGIYLINSSPTLTGNTISDNTTYGINIVSGAPQISTTTFAGNGNYDIYCSGSTAGTLSGNTIANGIYIGSGAAAGITGNTIAYNNSYPLRLGADGIGELLSANTITNTDSQSVMDVTADTIERDATWTAALKYRIQGNPTVQGADGADSITTLTIEPGVEIRMTRYRQMIIGGSSGDPGALSAQGTAADPIVFTSNEASPAAGDWYYIKFNNTSADSTTVMDHCVVEYAGYNQGACYLYSASPTITNTAVRFNKNAGIYLINSSPTLTGNTISDNTTYGINIVSGAPQISTTTFAGNGNYDIYCSGSTAGTLSGNTIAKGIYIGSGAAAGITGNTIAYNNSYPIRLGADGIGELLSANTITNTDSQSVVDVTADTIERDATWTAALKYRIQGNITVKGTDGADNITT